MPIKLALILVILSLIIGLQSSTTHYGPVIRHYFLQAERENAYEGLWPSAKNGSNDSLQALARLAAANSDQYWLSKAASLNSIEAQIALADLTEGEERVFWWRKAAENGHTQSQFELSLIEPTAEARLQYLKQAAENDFTAAVIALANYYYEQQNIGEAKTWLAKAAEVDAESAYKFARILWLDGAKQEASEQFKIAAMQNENYESYAKLSAKPRQKLSSLISVDASLNENCSQQLQLVATSLDSAVQATHFKTRFDKDARFDSLPICLNEPIWVEQEELACVAEGDRKTCALPSIANKQFAPNYTHIVLIVDTSKAYVNQGLMVLDEADTYSVFIHELAHFVGFVDEYAVSAELSENYCNNAYAPNLLVAEETDVEQHENFDLWQSYVASLNEQRIEKAISRGDDIDNLLELEISASRTCQKLSINAFKPSSEMTFLEYHDTANIPPLYIAMWQDLLTQYHHEVAIAHTFRQQAIAPESKAYWEHYLR